MQLFLVTVRGPKGTGDRCSLIVNEACSDPLGKEHTGLYRMRDDATVQGVKEWLEHEGLNVVRVEIAL